MYLRGRELLDRGRKLAEGMDNLVIGEERKDDKMPGREKKKSE
jgi:hypothetical protein